MATATVLALADIRDAAAAVLAPADDDDPYVIADVVDSVTPPALEMAWDDPWLEAGAAGIATMGPCTYTARLRIVCIAGRLDPGTGVDELERLVSYVLERMRADAYTWPLDRVTAPLERDQGGISALVCEVIYAVPTTT